MRVPRPKIHLIDVPEPIVGFKDLRARCGVVVTNGELIFAYTADSPRESIKSEPAGIASMAPRRRCGKDTSTE